MSDAKLAGLAASAEISAAGFTTLEDEWRLQCKHFAKRQDLSHVRSMRIASVVRPCLPGLAVALRPILRV